MRIALCTRHLADMTSLNIMGSLARELSRQNHAPFLYTASPDSKTLRTLKFPLHILPNKNDQALARSLAKVLSQDKIELVHLRLGGAYRNPFVWSLSRLSKLKQHPRLSLQFDDFGNPDLPLDCPRTARDLKKLMLGGAHVAAVSRAVRDCVVSYWPRMKHRVQVIGNGVDLDWAERCNGHKHFVEPYILSVGRPARYKGMDLLIFAFAEIADKFPVNLVITGPDMENNVLRRLVRKLKLENRVRFAGFTEHRKLPGLLQSAEFFVLASRWESFGIAALEAMAAGKAVIAPRLGGFLDYIEDGKTGLLFSPEDPRALANAMRQLLNHPSQRRALGSAARQMARRRSWSAVADQYLRLWRDHRYSGFTRRLN